MAPFAAVLAGGRRAPRAADPLRRHRLQRRRPGGAPRAVSAAGLIDFGDACAPGGSASSRRVAALRARATTPRRARRGDWRLPRRAAAHRGRAPRVPARALARRGLRARRLAPGAPRAREPHVADRPRRPAPARAHPPVRPSRPRPLAAPCAARAAPGAAAAPRPLAARRCRVRAAAGRCRSPRAGSERSPPATGPRRPPSPPPLPAPGRRWPSAAGARCGSARRAARLRFRPATLHLGADVSPAGERRCARRSPAWSSGARRRSCCCARARGRPVRCGSRVAPARARRGRPSAGDAVGASPPGRAGRRTSTSSWPPRPTCPASAARAAPPGSGCAPIHRRCSGSTRPRRPATPRDAARARRARRRPPQRLFYDDPPEFVRGWGHHLYDADGRAYVDPINNVAVVGHSHPRVAAAAARAAPPPQHQLALPLRA